MSMTALTLPAAMKESAGGRSLQVWLKEGETTTSLGVYDPPGGGAASPSSTSCPSPASRSSHHGAGRRIGPGRTTPPLVTLRVSEDADRDRHRDRLAVPRTLGRPHRGLRLAAGRRVTGWHEHPECEVDNSEVALKGLTPMLMDVSVSAGISRHSAVS